jgi:hypothetical protein
LVWGFGLVEAFHFLEAFSAALQGEGAGSSIHYHRDQMTLMRRVISQLDEVAPRTMPTLHSSRVLCWCWRFQYDWHLVFLIIKQSNFSK